MLALKVSYFEVQIRTQHQVIWLDVTVQHAETMDIGQASAASGHQATGCSIDGCGHSGGDSNK